VLGGYLWQTVALSAPFVAAGGLKILYDVILLGTFRRVNVGAATPRPE
jgi:hypothetical protein